MQLLNSVKRIRGIILKGLLVTVCCGLIFGYGTAIIGPVVRSLVVGNPNIDKRAESIITAAAIFGAFIGAPAAGIMADNLGRKPALITGFVLGLIGNTIVLFYAFSNYWVLSLGRLFFGMSLGVCSSIGPLYMSETSPNDMRGFLGVFFQVSITFSIFLGALTSFFQQSPEAWLWINVLLYIPILLLGLLLLIVPESPRYLVKTNPVEAKILLIDIFGTEELANAEIEKIKKFEKGSVMDLFKKRYLLPNIIGVVLAMAQQLTGINAIIFYFNNFSSAWFPSNNTAQSSVFAGIMAWNMLTALVSVPLTKRYGRRRLLLCGQVLMVVSLLTSFLSYYFGQAQIYFTIIGICMFIAGFEISVGPLFFVIINEIYVENLRGSIGSFMNSILWFFNFVLTLSFNFIYDALAPDPANPNGYVFLIFASVGLLCLVFLYVFLPETKDKTFENIENAMSSCRPYSELICVKRQQVEQEEELYIY